MLIIIEFFRLMLKPKAIALLFVIGFFIPLFANGGNTGSKNDDMNQAVRFEHLALNIKDVKATVKWYKENLGFKVIREGGAPTFNTFLADADVNFMFELYQNTDYPALEFSKFDFNSIHLAFSCDSITAVKEKLLANDATIADDLRETSSGDQVLVLRDPWGLPIQFVQRVKPMLKFNGIFFEHLAMNQKDSREKAKWFVDNLGMKVMRDGKPPEYGMFVADASENMMFELYQKKDYEVIDFTGISNNSFHIAFVTENVEATKENLLKNGATIADDIRKTDSGDVVLTLRDLWGMPIQFVQRVKPMLK